MENNIIDIKPINKLLEFGFFIPAYQRGYRWTEQQVEDLLNDIAEFTPKEIENSKDKTWYCLQPLVIKKCDEATIQKQELDTSRKWLEVIDGQQRLTSIFLILHYLNQGYVENRRKILFELHYATRANSRKFLKEKLDENNVDNSNIDFCYISKAYSTIHKWFTDKGQSFDISDLESKFLFSTKVIWYESMEDDPITIFTRINMGKIPLTNAELIKALFLNSSNFKNADSEKIRLKQLEIATEWDRIEYALHNTEFWYFINEAENNLSTRIEFIFDLMANKSTDAHADADEYYTFTHFSKKFQNNSNEEITNNWNEIKQYFQTLDEWFIDRVLYHKIGFLLSVGVKIGELLELSYDLTKTGFKKALVKEISKKVNVDLDDLEYGNAQVRRVLLLHNIQSMLNNKLENSRFPFDKYKVEKWDVEHIHSVQEKSPKTEKHQKDWLNEALKFIKDEVLKQKAERFSKEDFESIFNDVLKYFSENKQHEEINDISNLALLDSKTNRGYGNAVFPVKRKTIIDKDSSGTFIPLCTKNVFMKYYSNDVSQMTFWGEKDRSDYLNKIKDVLKPYIQI